MAADSHSMATITATDADSPTLTYSIAGGDDAARFAIDAASGALRFVTAPDFEAPADANGDNVGECKVPASAEVTPLSSDKQALLAKVAGLTTGGGTAGHLGTAWAWYMLSPKWSSIWSDDSRPGSYSDLTTIGENGKPLLHPDDPHIVAVAADTPLPQATVPVIDLNDIDKVCDVLLKHAVSLQRAAVAMRSA